MKYWFLSALCAAVLMGCNQKPDNQDTPATDNHTATEQVLKVATEGAYAPFNYTNADGSLGGFDIDVANALCDKMQVKCQINAQDWEGIIPALQQGKYDAIVAAMSVTPERSAQVAFSEPYYTNSLVFLAKNDSSFDPSRPEDIANTSIAAQRSTISSQWLQATHPNAHAQLYDTLDNAFLDLGAGRAGAMVADKVPALTWLKSELGKGFVVKGQEIDIQDHMAVAVKKDNEALLGQINQALAAIKSDGTYDAIVKKYFDPSAVNASSHADQTQNTATADSQEVQATQKP